MMKKVLLILMLLVLMPQVLADVRGMGPEDYAIIVPVLLLGNYIINVIIVLIQSKIWLNIPFKKIATGLAIITPIMFFIESLFTNTFFRYFFDYYGVKIGIASFPIIFACYLFISLFYWKIETKKSIVTATIMAIITNPGTYIFLAYRLDYLLSIIY